MQRKKPAFLDVELLLILTKLISYFILEVCDRVKFIMNFYLEQNIMICFSMHSCTMYLFPKGFDEMVSTNE